MSGVKRFALFAYCLLALACGKRAFPEQPQPVLYVLGTIAFLNADGSVVASHSAVFSSVEACQKAAPAAIAQGLADVPELKGTKAILACWDTRAVKASTPKQDTTPLRPEQGVSKNGNVTDL